MRFLFTLIRMQQIESRLFYCIIVKYANIPMESMTLVDPVVYLDRNEIQR